MIGKSDDELPNWLHTTLTLVIVSPFALLLIVPSIAALRSGILEPTMGSDFGFYLFGDQTLYGHLARRAGWALMALGLSMFAIGINFCRFAQGHLLIQRGLWIFWVSTIVLYFFVYRSVIP